MLNGIFICLPPTFWFDYKKWQDLGKDEKNPNTEKKKRETVSFVKVSNKFSQPLFQNVGISPPCF